MLLMLCLHFLCVMYRFSSTVIDKVVASVNSETARHSDLPPLVTLMTRKRVVDEDLGILGLFSSLCKEAKGLITLLNIRCTRRIFYHLP